MLSDESSVRFFCMTRVSRAPEIACDVRKQELYRLNRRLDSTVLFSLINSLKLQSQKRYVVAWLCVV